VAGSTGAPSPEVANPPHRRRPSTLSLEPGFALAWRACIAHGARCRTTGPASVTVIRQAHDVAGSTGAPSPHVENKCHRRRPSTLSLEPGFALAWRELASRTARDAAQLGQRRLRLFARRMTWLDDRRAKPSSRKPTPIAGGAVRSPANLVLRLHGARLHRARREMPRNWAGVGYGYSPGARRGSTTDPATERL